ncbi:MAG TPA: preprotein translocase subunit SecY [Candidatus Diapherotrites archaeon]|nr:preprotein translocase subunit SecY [Candidatus Diapherotrites archaeon]
MSFFDGLLKMLPSVKEPSKVPNTRQKLLWTLVVLVVYFILGTITLYGLDPSKTANISMYQMILASDIGTLITLGIGPIVLASIILQLLAGVKIINFDFSKPEERARFSGAQKLLAIVLAIVEAIIYSVFGMLVPAPGMLLIVIIQIVLGAIIVIYLDEVVSKYGIGSGIGLFIAGGVCQTIIWKIFSFPNSSISYPGGLLFQGISYATTGAMTELLAVVLLPILFTLLVFFAVVYIESIHVNIPLTVGRSGMGANFPVKLLYVSNMPVILTGTLFANIALFASLAKGKALGNFLTPIANFLNPSHGLLQTAIFGGATLGMVLSVLGYSVLFVIMCVIFGKFWVEVGGQGTEEVASQLQRSGMSIPGFRRDERVLVTVLKRYIPTIVVMGSITVGLLAVFADMTGAIGTGTGILLTVGIVYKFYEQLAKDQLFESGNFLKTMLNK